MSKSSDRAFKCMKCGHVYNIKTYDSISANVDYDLKEKTLSRDIFQYECPSCHSKYYLTYPCLYHDEEKKFMVWLCDEKYLKNIDLSVFKELINNGYKLRRCDDISSFVEKIQVFEDGLDDRVVEFIKYDSFVDYIENKKVDFKEIDGIYYHGYDNGVLKINIRTNDKGATILVPYDAALSEIEKRSDLFELENNIFPIIDSKWIINIFEGAQNKA